MKKGVILGLFLVLALFLVASCKSQTATEPVKEFCGNGICEENEKDGKCAADCGGFQGLNKRECEFAGGNWNDCGSPCAGSDAEFCIQVCQAQCECDNKQYTCPEGFKCRLSEKKPDEMGVCVKE